ncbi:MAG: hypothetical protein K9J17_03170 [Flavobacteriales bacterium]|nr:hypothetical protein [Flavobacteriales bacterium]
MKNWRELLYERWDSDKSQRISSFIATNEAVFQEVFNSFYAEEGHIAHRSGFILGQTFKKKPSLLIPKIEMLIGKMQEPPHEWYRWMTIWYLSHCNFPSEHDGLAATYAFEELGKSYAKPAVKNASMRLLEFICKRNPELIPEFKLYLEEIIENERPTLVAKAKKQLSILKKHEQ